MQCYVVYKDKFYGKGDLRITHVEDAPDQYLNFENSNFECISFANPYIGAIGYDSLEILDDCGELLIAYPHKPDRVITTLTYKFSEAHEDYIAAMKLLYQQRKQERAYNARCLNEI